MYPFVETLALFDGKVLNLELHQQRMDRTLNDHQLSSLISLDEVIAPYIKDHLKGLFKCRVVYDKIVHVVEIHAYSRPLIHKVGILETAIDYTYKSTDRSCFSDLHKQYPGFDDFLLLRNGELTDSTFCNIALKEASQWYTPANPLLAGVQRAHLLEEKKIEKRIIRIEDLSAYTQISFFNALNPLGLHLLDIEDLIDLRQIEPVL